MKKLLFILVAIFIASFASNGQDIVVKNLKSSNLDSLMSKEEVKLTHTKISNPYGQEVKFKDIKAEDLVDVYKITEITKSRKMVTDTTGTHPEATTQWFITFKDNGTLNGFWTAKDPLSNIEATKNSLAIFMASGITQGDDEETNVYSKNDAKYASKDEMNVEIPESPNGF